MHGKCIHSIRENMNFTGVSIFQFSHFINTNLLIINNIKNLKELKSFRFYK